MNLHATVRGAINTVNPDVLAAWQVSTGYSTDAAGLRTPTYATAVNVFVQVQAAGSEDLQHVEKLNQQANFRKVFMFGLAAGVVRPDAKGGDLLTFPQVLGGTPQTWLVVHVLEQWAPDPTGWCSVIVALQ